MKEERQGKLKISNDLLDAMLVGVKTQDDLWGKEGIITQINKALLERILNAEMDFHLNNTDEGRSAGNTRNGYGRKSLCRKVCFDETNTLQILEKIVPIHRKLYRLLSCSTLYSEIIV